MARAKVIHSEDSVMIQLRGDKRNPEPHTAVIQFAGGEVEVSRTSDGNFWAHLHINESAEVVDSRVDYLFEEGRAREDAGKKAIPKIENQEMVKKMAVCLKGPFESSADL